MKFKGIFDFVRNVIRTQQRILRGLPDIRVIERVRFSFSYPLQVGTLNTLKSMMGFSPWCKLDLPYGIKCLYNASEGITGSIDSIIFKKECFLSDLYKPQGGEVVVDVGAYVGLYSILSSILVGNNGFVVAIEPVPGTFRLLEKNVRLNNLSNVLLLNFALSDQDDEQEFYVPHVSTAGSSFHLGHLKAQKVQDYAKIRVKVQTFDNLTEKISLEHVDIMKVDVEGAELSVLQGARNSLEKGFIDKLVIEIHKTINTPEILKDFLETYKYVIDAHICINKYTDMLYACRVR